MTVVANLYAQCRVDREWTADTQQQILGFESAKKQAEEIKEAKRKEKEEKLKRKQEEEERRRQQKAAKNRPARVPFNFETVGRPSLSVVFANYCLGQTQSPS